MKPQIMWAVMDTEDRVFLITYSLEQCQRSLAWYPTSLGYRIVKVKVEEVKDETN